MNLQEKYEKIDALMQEASEIASTEEELTFIALSNNGKRGSESGSYSLSGLALALANSKQTLPVLTEILPLAELIVDGAVIRGEEAEDDE